MVLIKEYVLKCIGGSFIEMTTFGQAEFEALGLLEKKHTTSVRVTRTLTNHPDMLTDKELQVTCPVSRVTCPCNVLLQDVTAVFRSLETGLREATMDPKVFR